MIPDWIYSSKSDVNYAIKRLIEVGRPRAAFYSAKLYFDDLESLLLKKVLTDVVYIHSEKSNHYLLESYYVHQALESLISSRPDITRKELAQLEFYFIDSLKSLEEGTPNLEEDVLNNPCLFVDVVNFTYERHDGQEDLKELINQTLKQKSVLNRFAHLLLDSENLINKVAIGSSKKAISDGINTLSQAQIKVIAIAILNNDMYMEKCPNEWCGEKNLGEICIG